MDFELYPTITIRSRSFNALLAPREVFIQALNRKLNLQRFKVLYITGNYSAILSRLDRRFEALEIFYAAHKAWYSDLERDLPDLQGFIPEQSRSISHQMRRNHPLPFPLVPARRNLMQLIPS